jgi:hypothetical protein
MYVLILNCVLINTLISIYILMFSCINCKKELASKQSLLRHEEYCNGLDKFQCDLCHKLLSSLNSKYRHKKNKVCERNGTIIKYESTTTETESTTTNTTINNNNGTINNITINIMPFGKENIQYISNSTGFVNKCLGNGLQGLLDVIKSKHFNDKHPENKNIIKDNKRDKFLKIYNGTKWEHKLKDNVIKDIIDKCIALMDSISDDYMEDLTPQNLSKYIDKIQDYFILLKSLNKDYQEEYLKQDINDETIKKQYCYDVIDEFIYNESIDLIKKENEELKQQLILLTTK